MRYYFRACIKIIKNEKYQYEDKKCKVSRTYNYPIYLFLNFLTCGLIIIPIDQTPTLDNIINR